MKNQGKHRRDQIAAARQAVNEGRFEAAREICTQIFEDDPGHLAALQVYVSSTELTRDDPVFERLCTFAEAPNVPPPARSQVHFMLGKALDDIGDHTQAFEAFVTANRLKQVQFDAARKAAFAKRLIGTVAKAPRLALSSTSPRLVFVLGMPRSGSTLLAQMLGAHPNIISLGEVEALAPALTFLHGQQVRLPDFIAGMDVAALATARARYLQDLPAGALRSGNILVDKMPENYWLAWAIPMLFPDALILHMRRDKRAVCWSCFRNDFGHGHEYSYDWPSLVAQYDTHIQLASAWKEGDPSHWRDLALEDLTASPKKTLLPVLSALGVSWDDACLNPAKTGTAVKTLSKWKVRRGVDPNLTQGWRTYWPMIKERWGST